MAPLPPPCTPESPRPGSSDEPLSKDGQIAGIAISTIIGAFLIGSLLAWVVVAQWEKRGRFSIRLNDLISGRLTTGDGPSPTAPTHWRGGRHPAAAAPIDRDYHQAAQSHGYQTDADQPHRRSYRHTSIMDLHGQSQNATLITAPPYDEHWNHPTSFGPVVNYVSFSAFQNSLNSAPLGPPPPYQPTLAAMPSARVAAHTQATSHHGAYHSELSDVNESPEEDDEQPLFTNRRLPTPRHAVGIANSGIRPSR